VARGEGSGVRGQGSEEEDSLAPDPSPLAPGAERLLAADGRAYRAWLKAELVRLAGIVRAEAEAALLVQALEGQPAAKWLPVIASFQARVDALLPPRPLGQPPGAGAAPVPRGGRPFIVG
jgi:hypothetical protein